MEITIYRRHIKAMLPIKMTAMHPGAAAPIGLVQLAAIRARV